MAKPMPQSPRRQTDDTLQSTPRRRQHRTTSLSSPSPIILSLLATVVASSTLACAGPTPLSFLCPSLGLEDRPNYTKPTFSAVVPQNLQPRRSKYRLGPPRQGRELPDKFEFDSGTGHWKRVSTWSLYGSTVCSSCSPTSTSMSVDDQIQTNVDGLDAAPAPTTTWDIRDTLPPGWTDKKRLTGNRITLILVGSLALAAAICFLTISCLFWRKRRRRKRKKDVEMKVQRRGSAQTGDDGEANVELIVKKGARVKQKIWARATARWKAHAHYSAIRRRGKRTVVSRTGDAHALTSAVSLVQTEQLAQPSTTAAAHTNSLSRRSSLESMYMDDPTAGQTSHSPTNFIESESRIIQHSSRPSSDSVSICTPAPPAYRQCPVSAQVATSTPSQQSETNNANAPPHPNRSSLASYASSDPRLESSLAHTAHVATDDKTVLAHLANLASIPPLDGSSNQEGLSRLSAFEASVPVWKDEELDDFGEAENTMTFNQSSGAPLFPSPPSKGKMSEARYYDYAYEVEEHSFPEAAAPPFEGHELVERTSYPPLDDIHLVPSAPPLADDSELGTTPSAPPLHDWPADSEQGEDREGLSPEHGDTERASPIPPVYGPISSDGLRQSSPEL